MQSRPSKWRQITAFTSKLNYCSNKIANVNTVIKHYPEFRLSITAKRMVKKIILKAQRHNSVQNPAMSAIAA